jgi:hypothetical protein
MVSLAWLFLLCANPKWLPPAVKCFPSYVECQFDGPTTAGDIAQPSALIAGDCHDQGIPALPGYKGMVIMQTRVEKHPIAATRLPVGRMDGYSCSNSSRDRIGIGLNGWYVEGKDQ